MEQGQKEGVLRRGDEEVELFFFCVFFSLQKKRERKKGEGGRGRAASLDVVILGEGEVGSLLELSLVGLDLGVVEDALGGLEGDGLDEGEGGLLEGLLGEVEEGLLKVVVGLCGDVVVLEVLLAVEGDLLGLHLAVLLVDLVAAEDDVDLLADAGEVAVPVGDVLVGVAGGDVKHDDGALTVDVVSVAEATELLLAGGIPDVEADLAKVGVEGQRAHLDSNGGDVLLLELSGDVSLDERGLSDSSVSNEHELEVSLFLLGFFCCFTSSSTSLFLGQQLFFFFSLLLCCGKKRVMCFC